MSRIPRRLGIVACAVIAACQSNPMDSPHAALLTNHGIEVTEELRAVVREASGFSSVRLSENDLTQSSVLVIERQQQRGPQGEVTQGRDLEMPRRFQLLTLNGRCWLVNQASAKRYRLYKAQCRVE